MFNFSSKIALLFVYWVYASSSTTAELVFGSSTDEAAILEIGIDDNIPSSTKANKVNQTTQVFKNEAYTLFQEPEETWIGSVQYCSHLGGSLVDILTEEEHHFITNLAKNAGLSSRISLWTGGHDINSEGTFKWIRNKGKVNETFFTFKNEIRVNKDENCLVFSHYRSEKFKLRTNVHCNQKRPFAYLEQHFQQSLTLNILENLIIISEI